MDGEVIVAFWAVSIVFVLTPGADWAYAISAGIQHRTVVPAVGGLLAGHLAATAIVGAGVGALVARSPEILTVLTVGGALYLLWLGAGAFSHQVVVHAEAEQAPSSWARQAAKGAGTSGLNPKVVLLFLALLPAFTNPEAAWPAGVQMLVLGLVHVANCAVVYLAVGMGAQRVLRTRPAAATAVTRISGVVMILLGIVLVTERLLG